MNIPPKYEDLVLKVAEMERREAALRESLPKPNRTPFKPDGFKP